MPHTYWYFWSICFGCRDSVFVMTFRMVVTNVIFFGRWGGGRTNCHILAIFLVKTTKNLKECCCFFFLKDFFRIFLN
jgi:hypothetical protein